MNHRGTGFLVFNWRTWWDKKSNGSQCTGFLVKAEEGPNFEKRLHRSPYVLRKLRKRDEVPLMRFVTDLNLAPELEITGPLKRFITDSV
jgi:hypothetical protein